MTTQHQSAIDLQFVSEQIARLGDEPGSLVPLLQAVQTHYHYLPPEALRFIADHTAIPSSAITSVATFYHQFRLKPAGQHILRICHGTACHVKGSELIEDALRRLLHLRPGEDTDADCRFTLERVGCIGCCTLAPVAQINGRTFGHLQVDTVANVLLAANNAPTANHADDTPITGRAVDVEFRVGLGSCCQAGGSADVQRELHRAARALGVAPKLKPIGCVGACHQTPMVEVRWANGQQRYYTRVTAANAAAIADAHLPAAGVLRKFTRLLNRFESRLLPPEPDTTAPAIAREPRDPQLCEFLGPQKRIATEHSGTLQPLDLDEYLAHGGFATLNHLPAPDAIIDQITRSGLRGRGGAGFLTGRKWAAVRAATGQEKFILCNGDEGDPGAFMDRMILESFPFRVLEGMAIAAAAVNARTLILYIRAEYPLAIERINQAIAICHERGLLSHLSITIKQGAGAFVCGEETALIASIEGRRGMPTLRPPYPAERGLWGRPTLINNVETFALVPWIMRLGPDAFAAIGTTHSKGTKVFALTGKVRRGGLIEVPMGITIRQIVEHIGGGIDNNRTFKAVQIGGPSGGCVPATLADTPVDYESLAAVGAIMGSGGLVVLDDTDCMVDIARYFLRFTQAESCGKCTFCRVGTKRMLEILDALAEGHAKPKMLDELDFLARQVKQSSLCGLGQTAPNPVLSTLHYFRDEYEAHLRGQCPAGKCKSLIRYDVNTRCIGCTKCAQVCPTQAIAFTPYHRHTVDAAACTRCDLCRRACPEHAIDIVPLHAQGGHS